MLISYFDGMLEDQSNRRTINDARNVLRLAPPNEKLNVFVEHFHLAGVPRLYFMPDHEAIGDHVRLGRVGVGDNHLRGRSGQPLSRRGGPIRARNVFVEPHGLKPVKVLFVDLHQCRVKVLGQR